MTVDPTVVIAAIGALGTAIGALLRKVYTDLVADRNFWRDLALEGLTVTRKAVDLAGKASSDAPGS